ncbi:hypothetical protein FACS1894201_03090 [Bacteroidia bacterium]|nr:hypothetical protein FACS1894201_03090 [Bacteroidia bacterium]
MFIASWVTLLCCYSQHADNENYASFGLGLIWEYPIDHAKTSHFPCVNASIERSVLKIDSIGLFSIGLLYGARYGYGKETHPIAYKESRIDMFFVPKINFYFHSLLAPYGFPRNMSLYAGVGLGINTRSQMFEPTTDILPTPDEFVDINKILFCGDIYLGYRYFWQKNAAAFVEIGYGLTRLKTGLVFKY